MSDPFFITTAISYPNGAPHIGHAYELIATDVIARFYRLAGRDVYFSTGTDDHGQKMYQTARDKNIEPLRFADEMTKGFRDMAAALHCTPDDFIRTSEPRHHDAVQEIWQKISANGDIYKDHYAGWYSVRDEAFYTESELEEKEGMKIAPTGTQVEWMEEESYFFKLSAYQDKLLELYETQPDFIQPDSRRNEIIQFVKSGLKDLSISRTSFDWGISVQNDPNHIVYVWMDALTNYLTVTGYPTDTEKNKRYWPASYHIVGKDITRFHAVYWPAFLMAANLPLPKHIFAHGFITAQGEKMSKSLGNVLDPFSLVTHYGVDGLRYFLMRDIPFGRDGSFSDEAIVNRVNADLANDLGNLAKRCLSMIHKNLDSIVPDDPALTAADAAIMARTSTLLEKSINYINKMEIHNYISNLSSVVSAINKYFSEQEPWRYKAENPTRMASILYVTAEMVRQCALIIQPVTPIGAAIILDNLAIPEAERKFANWSTPLSGGTKLPAPDNAFARLEISE